MARVSVEQACDPRKRNEQEVINQVFTPEPAENPDPPYAESHDKSIGQRVHQVWPETSARTGQPTERRSNLSKCIGDSPPRVFEDVLYPLLSKPLIDSHLIAAERLYVGSFLWTECLDRHITASIDALGWVMAERVRIVTDP